MMRMMFNLFLKSGVIYFAESSAITNNPKIIRVMYTRVNVNQLYVRKKTAKVHIVSNRNISSSQLLLSKPFFVVKKNRKIPIIMNVSPILMEK